MAPQRNAGAGAEAELPEHAGHYRLESCLGSGGMGVVHLARSTSGMKLAVKVVHAQFAKDPDFRDRFRQEVAAARRVSGAFTAPVVDADPDSERPWMATLFIPGPTLSEQVKRNGPMDPAQLRRLMAGLAEALRDIHRAGVVHRDLKPSNVLLADDGPKVIDFGISRPLDSELRTETGRLIGTPPFMAPEQFRRPREVGPAADIFALGSVMVHAATGQGPFDSDSPYIVAYQVVHDEPDLTGVPDEVAPLVLRCLAKEPEERPTPDELMRELRSVAASYDTQTFIPAQRTGDTERSWPPAGRPASAVEATSAVETGRAVKAVRGGGRRLGSRAVLGAGAFGLAVVGALISLPLLDGDGGSPQPASPRTTSAAFSGWQTTPAGEDSAPLCSHGAGRLLCATPGLVFALDPSDGRLLWRHPVGKGTRKEPPVLAGGLVQPSADRGRHLEALDPASGGVRWQRDMSGAGSAVPAGGMLLVTGADGKVTGVDGASGDPRWSHRIPGHDVPYIAAFTGDPLAYATSASGDGQSTRLTVVDPQTGDVRSDTRLDGTLKPFGATDGSVFLLSQDAVHGDARAVVRYTPGTGETRRVPLAFPLQQAHGAVRGNTAYLMGTGGSLVAVDLQARERLWQLETGMMRGSTPVAGDRHVYVTASDGRLLAVDARRGKPAGQTSARLGERSDRIPAVLPEPVIVGGRVYASAPDGTVFAVNGRDPAAW
ncbi:serine/threonine-protein kinase [Streptomyces cahuitamycinicus]|uniref:Serine/threonine protein kinase n=1 Tax=Streptomyces cahuitamycinicus TaxID=2070367 RepID=A0A2N8TGB0_9ACTN|nr:serine/threonine-protein kinase [Streptomyces cahuitamycinicus]PNG18057.1 serine/threonine protein kinase [Streptomyces cahuitamycinicus]